MPSMTKDFNSVNEVFYPWESVSIFRANYSTLDLVITDMTSMLALLHLLHKNVFNPMDNTYMTLYKKFEKSH